MLFVEETSEDDGSEAVGVVGVSGVLGGETWLSEWFDM